MKSLSLKTSRKVNKTNSGNNQKITQKNMQYNVFKNLEIETVKIGQRN